jgi:hypothetical protein
VAATQSPPDPAALRPLYEAAARVHALAPWRFMVETQLFGVRAGAGPVAFVSVMGGEGQHQAVAAYLGPEGLFGFLDLQRSESDEDGAELLLQIPQLQASFEARGTLQKADLDAVKALGLTPRGRGWPLFRSFRPGFVPWYVDHDEAAVLRAVLEQVLEVAPRVRADPHVLDATDGTLFVRAQDDGGGAWREERMAVAPPAARQIPFAVEASAIADLARLPRSVSAMEVDFFRFPAAIEEGPRPFYPHALLLADARSGVILGVDLLTPVESLERMWGQVPDAVVRRLLGAGQAPREMRARSELLLQLLEPLAAKVGFTLRRATSLPSADAARTGMIRTLAR